MTAKYRLTVRYWDGTSKAWLRSSLDSGLALGDATWHDSNVKSMVLEDILDGLTIKTWRP
jgi:hypothetical protein